jgi:polyhydroxyalkanoate synthesis regulator phasin
MASPSKEQISRVGGDGPDTLQAIREGLIAQQRAKHTAETGDCSGETSQSNRDHPNDAANAEAIGEGLHESPSISITEPPIDLASRLERLRDAKSDSNEVMNTTGFALPPGESLAQPVPELLRVSDRTPVANWVFARPAFRAVAGVIALIAIIIVVGALVTNGRVDLPKAPGLEQTQPQTAVAPSTSEVAPAPQPVAPSSSSPLPDRQLETTLSNFAVVQRQIDELAAKQEQMAKTAATRQDQLKGLLSDLAALRRQVEELAAKQAQMAGTIRQDQSNTASDLAALRRQVEELAAKQAQMAGTIRQDQSNTTASDLAALRRQVEELAAKQAQMAGTIRQDQSNTTASDLAALRRQVEELTAKQGGLADDIVRLQASERILSQRIGVRTRSHRR